MKAIRIISAIFVSLGFCSAALATPDTHQETLLSWAKNHSFLPSLTFVEKLKQTDPDFETRVPTSQGTLHFSAHLSPDEFVEYERIQYRPSCFETDTPGCQGTLDFEPNTQTNGVNLIKFIWGNEIFEDFQSAQLMMTDNSSGTQKWYQGRLYNYETWHFRDNVNAHFAVVSKRSPQGQRIQKYQACLKEMCQYF